MDRGLPRVIERVKMSVFPSVDARRKRSKEINRRSKIQGRVCDTLLLHSTLYERLSWDRLMRGQSDQPPGVEWPKGEGGGHSVGES